MQIAYITWIFCTRKVCFCTYKNPCNSRSVVLSLIFKGKKSYKRFNEGDSFRKYDVFFSIFRHKGNSALRICKGTFHSTGKKSPELASLVRYFLSFALDKSPCFVSSCLGKKKKIMLFSVVFSAFLGSEWTSFYPVEFFGYILFLRREQLLFLFIIVFFSWMSFANELNISSEMQSK